MPSLGATDYDYLVISDLTELESMGGDYNPEMKIIGKSIRNDFLVLDKYSNRSGNSKFFHLLLSEMNRLYKIAENIFGKEIFWTQEAVIRYITIIANQINKYKPLISKNLPPLYFEQLIDKITLSACRRTVIKQWKDVLSSGDGMKTFMEVFDDLFTNALTRHKGEFIHKLKKTDILTRAVHESDCDESRFVPWPSSRSQNRWNPPGKAFLYLSYMEKDLPYNEELSLGEYVCILECRTEKGTDCCFCKFEPVNDADIIDLSYNDVSLYSIRKELLDYQDGVVESTKDQLLEEISEGKLNTDEQSIKNRIHQVTGVDDSAKKIIEENTAKQILKIICSSIYEKVDGTEAEKEEAYRSFHILSEYLEKKGLSGIIYPCTRNLSLTQGKNVVLFDRLGAKPIKGTIRHYTFNG